MVAERFAGKWKFQKEQDKIWKDTANHTTRFLDNIDSMS